MYDELSRRKLDLSGEVIDDVFPETLIFDLEWFYFATQRTWLSELYDVS